VTADVEPPRLRELRTDLGWTQRELAERLANLAWMQRHERVGVNSDMTGARKAATEITSVSPYKGKMVMIIRHNSPIAQIGPSS
jgi:hypothetical protein